MICLAGLLCTSVAAIVSSSPCTVIEYGAKGDNRTEDTAAFVAALAACTATGVPTVVPPGTYLVRPIQLHSDTHLQLQPGSTLAAWGDRYTWPNSTNKPCDFGSEGSGCCLHNLPCCVPQKESLLWATNATNVKINGGGVIDGNAPNNDWHRGPSNASADGTHVSGDYGDYWHQCRPRMVELRWTDDAVIDNITIKNSIMFNVHTARGKGTLHAV
jgi:polygalacturonase